MVYDHNSILSDELLGYFSLPAAHAVEAGQQALERGQAATPQWHTVTLSGNPGHSPSTSDARVLASFVLLPSPSRTAAPRSPGFVDRMLEMPAMRSVLLEVNVIGLRGPLKPYAGFPISSTSVRVSLGAFDDSLQVLKMSVKCPEQPIFCPTLRCDVIEHRIGGSAVHNIGTAFVPLARYLPWSAPSAEEDDTHAHDRLGKTTSPRVQTLPSTRSPPSSSAASSSSATGAVNGASSDDTSTDSSDSGSSGRRKRRQRVKRKEGKAEMRSIKKQLEMAIQANQFFFVVVQLFEQFFLG
eukprot:gene8637-10249_t